VELAFTYSATTDQEAQKNLLLHAVRAIEMRITQSGFPGA
jgi:hypothetical protein